MILHGSCNTCGTISSNLRKEDINCFECAKDSDDAKALVKLIDDCEYRPKVLKLVLDTFKKRETRSKVKDVIVSVAVPSCFLVVAATVAYVRMLVQVAEWVWW